LGLARSINGPLKEEIAPQRNFSFKSIDRMTFFLGTFFKMLSHKKFIRVQLENWKITFLCKIDLISIFNLKVLFFMQNLSQGWLFYGTVHKFSGLIRRFLDKHFLLESHKFDNLKF
jgi:hypothetical protein